MRTFHAPKHSDRPNKLPKSHPLAIPINWARNTIISSVLTIAILSCNTTGLMDLPRLPGVHSSATIDLNSDSATFGISKLAIDIARGDPILHFPGNDLNTHGTLCNYNYNNAIVTYGMKTTNVDADLGTIDELRAAARDTLSKNGHSVAGDPRDIFDQQASLSSAEYLIGSRIFEIRGNICQSFSLST